ncbi:glycosyltransferase family 2 protein, partial [Candidatus Dependentiae bacterium]|nr:glycosyltransferase family 2 protein [Candidatus Dependentiae bacterium]
MNNKNLIILIPAYNPPKDLIKFSEKLIISGFEKIIIINDGSDKKYN